MSKKLTAKIFITGRIVAETGLHIGGSKSSLDIGGVDLNVIKTPHGQPFIPGSSLKGKLRSMLARKEGSEAVSISALPEDDRTKARRGEIDTDEAFNYLLQLFGSSGDADGDKSEVTRLIVRDALLDTTGFREKFKDTDMDFDFSYVKWENTINRRTGTAQHPRQLERVPAGAEFKLELVYDVYSDGNEDYKTGKEPEEKTEPRPGGNGNISILEKHRWAIETAMDLLQDDYLGGQGSRGYGQISFKEVEVMQRVINQETGIYGPPAPVENWQSIAQKFQNKPA